MRLLQRPSYCPPARPPAWAEEVGPKLTQSIDSHRMSRFRCLAQRKCIGHLVVGSNVQSVDALGMTTAVVMFRGCSRCAPSDERQGFLSTTAHKVEESRTPNVDFESGIVSN